MNRDKIKELLNFKQRRKIRYGQTYKWPQQCFNKATTN